MLKKQWQQRTFDAAFSRQISKKFGLPLAIAEILSQRGHDDEWEIESFLKPSLNQLPQPFLMKGMEEAVSIVVKAVGQGGGITVFGDYDVDGVTATAVLVRFFKMLGREVPYFIPNRLTEGYGLNNNGIEKLAEAAGKGTEKVLIAVDCGISGLDEVRFAQQQGFKVIIADHHQPSAVLPQADAILNPLQPGCTFPDKNLAGVGLAFYLIMGIRIRLSENKYWSSGTAPNLKEYLDLVSMGTVADLVPLTGANRVCVQAGLEVLNGRIAMGTMQCGLEHLFKLAKIDGPSLNAGDIAFRIAPRINAAGRIGSAREAVDLLLTDDIGMGVKLAGYLENANQKRKKLTEEVFDRALMAAQPDMIAGKKALVLWDPTWHPGVLGIVAARLTEECHYPVLLLALHDGVAKGSGRTARGMHLYDALTECESLLVRYGGHAGAVGLTVVEDNLEPLRNRFAEVVSQRFDGTGDQPAELYDREIFLDELFDTSFLEYYVRLGPFGFGNPEPVFLCRNVFLERCRRIGTLHLRFSCRQSNREIQGVGFGFGVLADELEKDPARDVLFRLHRNMFRGSESWEIGLIDIYHKDPTN